MKILFTRGNSPLSKAILSVTGENVSHCAVYMGPTVAHSNLLGVGLEWTSYFMAKTRVVYALERVVPTDAEDLEMLDKTLTAKENSFYGFASLLFVGLALLARHYLKLPLPKSNLWEISGTYMCTQFVQEITNQTDDAMITPEGLYNKMKASGLWKDIDG